MAQEVISSNAIALSIVIDPELKGGEIESFSDSEGVWVSENAVTAGSAITPDGKKLVWGKNTLYKRTLNLSPKSATAIYIEKALQKTNRRGSQVSNPSTVTVTVRNILTGACDTYLGGHFEEGALGMNVGLERLENKQYVLIFDQLILSPF